MLLSEGPKKGGRLSLAAGESPSPGNLCPLRAVVLFGKRIRLRG